MNKHEIVAYRHQVMWYEPTQVVKARISDKGAFMDAHPYTIPMLHRRREYGRDLPDWIDLDDQAYFWSKAWQAGERQADEDIVAGHVETFDPLE